MKDRRNVVSNMSPWEARYVGDLIEELERRGRIPASTAERARQAAAEGRYRDALDVALDVERLGNGSGNGSSTGSGNGSNTGSGNGSSAGSDHADDSRRTDGGFRTVTADR